MVTVSVNEETRRIANLRVLQRVDPFITDIVGSATHVVLYEFNELAQAWEKRNVEGSLFVAKRSDSPCFKLIIMNRIAKENLEISLAAKFQMQVREPYLIFRVDEGKENTQKKPIRGIWFHDGQEREAIYNVLKRILKTLVSSPELEKKEKPKKIMDLNDGAASLIACLKIGENIDQEKSTLQEQPRRVGHSSVNETSQLVDYENPILDKRTLQLSLMSLLQDERFLDLIHSQYLKVAHARTKKSTRENIDGSKE